MKENLAGFNRGFRFTGQKHFCAAAKKALPRMSQLKKPKTKGKTSMKKQQNNSMRGWALHVALSIALLSISAVLLASSFKATPATRGLSAPINPVAAGDRELVIAGTESSQSLSPVYAPFTFGNTGSLNTGRYWHTATLLPNGNVLVAGGVDSGGALASAELYDPATGAWTATGDLGAERGLHTATLLPNGKVLVAGAIVTAAF